MTHTKELESVETTRRRLAGSLPLQELGAGERGTAALGPKLCLWPGSLMCCLFVDPPGNLALPLSDCAILKVFCKVF